MNAIVSKIDNLRSTLSHIIFQEHLSDKDYERMDSIRNEIQDLLKQLSGVKLCAVKVTHNRLGFNTYLTADSSLCFCDEPTWFDDEEEAQKYYKEAELSDDYSYEYEWRTF